MPTHFDSLHIAILAAGQGKRMKSSLPKVLHLVLFRPMVHHVLDLAATLKGKSTTLVVGHGEELVRQACASFKKISYSVQKEQKGTAHATQTLEKSLGKQKGHLLLLSGDVILLKEDSIRQFLTRHFETGATASLVTTEMPNPTGYGRILRKKGQVVGIREEADASESEKKIGEINAGIYCFDIASLFSALRQISSKNKQQEFYLTDVIEIFVREGKKVEGHLFADPSEIMGINDRSALAEAEVILQTRINQGWMACGVTLHNPSTIFIDPTSQLSPEVSVEQGTVIVRSEISSGTYIESGSRIIDSKVGQGVRLKQGSYIEESEIGDHVSIGPYAHLRPGSVLERDVKIGNFVEIKKSRLKRGAKASHLAYIGDAEIGKDANLGCGFITCNYDGVKKHKTIVEDGVFVGSDSQTVAPVTLGKGSYIASGSTITEDVPPYSLALSRGRQVTKKGYLKRSGKK